MFSNGFLTQPVLHPPLPLPVWHSQYYHSGTLNYFLSLMVQFRVLHCYLKFQQFCGVFCAGVEQRGAVYIIDLLYPQPPESLRKVILASQNLDRNKMRTSLDWYRQFNNLRRESKSSGIFLKSSWAFSLTVPGSFSLGLKKQIEADPDLNYILKKNWNWPHVQWEEC